MTDSFDRAAIKTRAEAQTRAYARMLELNGGAGLLGVREPGMFNDMIAWGNSTKDDHADTVLALLAALEEAEREADNRHRINRENAKTQELLYEARDDWKDRAEEAERRIAAVDRIVNDSQTVGWIERDGDEAFVSVSVIRAALHPAAETTETDA